MMFKKFSWGLNTLSKLCCCWSGLSGLTCLTLTLSQQRKLILNPQVTSSTRAGLKTSRNLNKYDAGFTHDPLYSLHKECSSRENQRGSKAQPVQWRLFVFSFFPWTTGSPVNQNTLEMSLTSQAATCRDSWSSQCSSFALTAADKRKEAVTKGDKCWFTGSPLPPKMFVSCFSPIKVTLCNFALEAK